MSQAKIIWSALVHYMPDPDERFSEARAMYITLTFDRSSTRLWVPRREIIEKKVTLYKTLTIEGKLYFDTLAGKMELIYLMEYYKFIEMQFRQFYRDM
jgi:hypothetical protein